MAEYFDGMVFNGEAFGNYIDTMSGTHLKMLLSSGAIVEDNSIREALSEQTGGYYYTKPINGNIENAVADNYDGVTNMSEDTIASFSQSVIVTGRMKGFKAKDFAYELTGGNDKMKVMATQVSGWQDMNRQKELFAILEGVFKVDGFTNKHTYDITTVTNASGVVGEPDATTFNTAMQRACGDKKRKFSLILMDSATATKLENQNLLTYIKFNDENGMQRDTDFATLNGKLVLVDDDAPTFEKKIEDGTAGVYSLVVNTALGAGDSLEIAGVTYEYSSGTTSKTAQATAIAAAINSGSDVYSATASSDTVTITEISGAEGTGSPELDDSGLTTGAVTLTTNTSGKSAVYRTAHISYVLGNGSIKYTNCGAKTPYETGRDPVTNGGVDKLYVRQRDCFAPDGFSFTKKVLARKSPSNPELANGANWEMIHTEGENPDYMPDKLISIARVISF